LFLDSFGLLRGSWHFLVVVPLTAEHQAFLLKRRKTVTWLRRHGTLATVRSRFVSWFRRLEILTSSLILALPILCLLQLTLELFDAPTFGCLFDRLKSVGGIASLRSLVLAQELAVETIVILTASALPLLLQALLSVVLFRGAARLLFFPLALFLIPTLLLRFHLDALLLSDSGGLFFPPALLFSLGLFLLLFDLLLTGTFGLFSLCILLADSVLLLTLALFLLCKAWNSRSGCRDLSTSTERNSLVALTSSAHVAILVDIPSRSSSLLISLLGPGTI
jgi:hypothetical protein